SLLGACSAPVCATVANGVRFMVGDLAAGQSTTVTVAAQLNPSVPDGTVIQNTISASSDLANLDAFSSSATSTLTVSSSSTGVKTTFYTNPPGLSINGQPTPLTLTLD